MSNEWVMVPREPTRDMIDAAQNAPGNASYLYHARVYRAMLDAAPAAPQQAEPAPTKRWWTDADELLLDSARDILIKSSIRVAGNEDAILRLMKSAPAMTGAQMEAATVSDEASQERAAIAYKRGYDEALNDCIRNGGEAWARSMFADQGEHIKPQEQAEPVAWPAGHRWARNMAALESQSESDPTAPIIAPQRAEPVAWRDHVEQRLHNWRQRTMNRSGDRLALDDMMSKESIDDLIDYVCDEWSDPVAPRQAEPAAWVRNLTDAQPHCVTGLQYRTAADADAGVQYIPLYLHPPAAEVQRLREAAYNAIEAFDQGAHGADEIDALRRALEGK